MPLEFQDKTVLLVDDYWAERRVDRSFRWPERRAPSESILPAAPVRYPNVYGIDMPAANELIAHGRSVDQVREEIGADWLVYQDLEDLIECSREGNPKLYESSVFDGRYQAGDIDEQYLQSIEAARADGAKGRALPSQRWRGRRAT